MITIDPGFCEQKVMNLVGNDQLLKINMALPELFNHFNRLAEWYIAVIVPMNKEYR